AGPLREREQRRVRGDVVGLAVPESPSGVPVDLCVVPVEHGAEALWVPVRAMSSASVSCAVTAVMPESLELSSALSRSSPPRRRYTAGRDGHYLFRRWAVHCSRRSCGVVG